MPDDYRVRIVGNSRRLQKEFIDFPKHLYRDNAQWVPWFDVDMRALLKKRHPYFSHARGEFLLVTRNGRSVARACISENDLYNQAHGMNVANFYFFDAEDDQEAVNILVEFMIGWSRDSGLTGLLGPILQGGATGSGILVEGFGIQAAMNMMPYNYAYYQKLLEGAGFSPFVNLYSMNLPPERFSLPDKVARVAELAAKRGSLEVLKFKSKRQVLKIADDIAGLYNPTLGDHFEDYPLSDAELEQVKKDLTLVADPALIKILGHKGRVVGFLFPFADLSDVMRRNNGKTGPVEILRLLSAMKQRKKVLFNGMGILPEYQKLGGNAILYREVVRTMSELGFSSAELVQISEKTELMLKDVEILGGEISKVHRMYRRDF